MITDEQAVALAQRWAAQSAFEDGLTGPSFEPDMLDKHELAALFAWVREQVRRYRLGAGFVPSREDFAEWIGLDLGEPFESGKALTEQLIDAAGALKRVTISGGDVLQKAQDWLRARGDEITATVARPSSSSEALHPLYGIEPGETIISDGGTWSVHMTAYGAIEITEATR